VTGNVKGKKGQVAVEFLFMFVIASTLLIYIFYFSLSLSALQYKQYITYMVGRTITSSSPTYAKKGGRATMLLAAYNTTDSSKLTVAGPPVCSIGDSSTGFRNILQYWPSADIGLRYDIFSTAGIACSVSLPDVLPGILLGKSKSLAVAVESMTGTEMSDEHCKCLLNFGKTWKDCLGPGAGVSADDAIIDNGC
jgi:hypothetical protein